MPSIENLLKRHKAGVRIINAYEKQKELHDPERSKIVYLIINYMDEQNIWYLFYKYIYILFFL